VLGLLGVGLLLQIEWLQWPIGLAGTAYLLWLDWDAWKAASLAHHVPQSPDQQTRSALKSGVILSLTNPQNLAYWAALGSALGTLGVTAPRWTDDALFFAGFMLASLSWTIFCAAAIDGLFKKAGQQWVAWTYRLCALAFFWLAMQTLTGLLATHMTLPFF
jgi:chemosensory pili system protein ChpE